MDESYKNSEAGELQGEKCLGSLLRATREERTVDLDEVAKATMVRRQYLEALENEEWNSLPSPVFVKGFLRSYAEFLGLDKELVLRYYLKNTPNSGCQPVMLREMDTSSGRWQRKFALSLVCAAFVAALFYLKSNDISVVQKAFQYLETRGPAEDKERIAQEKETKGVDTLEQEEPLTQGEAAAEQEKRAVSKQEPGEDVVVPESPGTSAEAEDDKALSPQLILTANVTSRTWVAIGVDNEPAKEYLFQPGENMRWLADKGFDLLVGNAGGIDLFLNGEPVEKLGPDGKVVRVKLPEGYGKDIVSKRKRDKQ